MRVVLLGSGVLPVPPPGWGAVERSIAGLAQALQALQVEVEVVQKVGKGRSLDEYKFALALPRMLEGKRWDVLHASTPVLANRLHLRKIPYVYTSHSRHWSGTSRLSERWGFYLERHASARAVRTLALTPEVARRMRRAMPPTRTERTRVIPHGIELERFSADWEVRFGTQILGVGAIHPRKRWHLAARVVREIPEATLTIVGPVQDETYARSLVEQAGGPTRLVLAGEVTDSELQRRYAASDVLLHPSGSELLSISVIEGMASSLPVVGTSILAEEVPEGRAGILVPETQTPTKLVEGLRDGVKRLMLDEGLRKTMSAAARQVAEERHAWPKVAQATLAVYQELVTPPS